jgi:aspartate-alanine antiporter
MDMIHELLSKVPLMALFIAICLGYLLGKFTIGHFTLGGISGSLIVGVLIGQFDVPIDTNIKDIFFALFIYCVGYQGGPQFFAAISLKTLTQLIAAFMMTLLGLLTVLGCAYFFNLDRGTAAGLAAGGLTQSAIIGTAGSSIANLDVSEAAKHMMQTNVAVGYAICYIFGTIGPILMVTWFFPTIMRWDLRKEALALASKMSGGKVILEPGQFNAVKRVDTRFYRVTPDSKAVGLTTLEIADRVTGLAVEAIIRNGEQIDMDGSTKIESGDVVGVTGVVKVFEQVPNWMVGEVTAPEGFELIEENRDIILNNKQFHGSTLESLQQVDLETRHGVFVSQVSRAGRDLLVAPSLELHMGDLIKFTGTTNDLNRIQTMVGHHVTSAPITDFVFFGLGLAIGMLIGLIHFSIFGVPVVLGSGVGCVLSGLFFGWLKSRQPRFASLPVGASTFLGDFGLAVFVAIVGINAGPQAVSSIKEYGMTLFGLGVAVTLLPQLIGFFFNYFILNIKNPIEACAAVVGGRSSNAGFAGLLDKAGNATPVVTFTVCYAVANVFLTLWGPVIVGVVTKNAAP